MRINQKNIILSFFKTLKRKIRNNIQIKKNISGKNNKINYNSNCYFINLTFNITGNNNNVIINNKCYLKDLEIYINGNNNNVIISDEVCFNNKSKIHIVDHNNKLKIGKCSTFEGVFLEITEPFTKITIGEDCMFSRGIELLTGDYHSILNIECKTKTNHSQDIEIGNHVWVGAYCVILKGVKIGNDNILGIKSLITKDFLEENTTIAGHPAKVIKKGTTWDRDRNYKINNSNS